MKKGRIITGRPVILDDGIKAGIFQLKPNLPPRIKGSRYWRQKAGENKK